MSVRRSVAFLCAALVSSLAFAGSAIAAPYDKDTLIVKFEPGTPGVTKTAALNIPGVGRTVGTVDGVGANVVRVSGDPATIARRLDRNPNVAYAEPNYLLSTQATPNDPLFPDEYGLHNTGQTGGTSDADIDAPEGWDAAGMAGFPQSGGVRVGVIDTGFERTHPDLAGKLVGCATSYTNAVTIIEGVCVDDNGHGTHVSGTITANTNNGTGVAGVAFNSPIVACKALATAAGVGLTSDIANCLNWTSNQGVKVISMSLGGGESSTLQTAVRNAAAKDILLVAAAGNDGDATLNYPAAYQEVMSVAATDDSDRRADFSNANGDVEIAAPGDLVTSTFLAGTYLDLSGTSMATPHVSGVAAVVFTQNPGISASSVRSRLTSTADDLGPAGRDPSFGFGRVNLCKAAGGSCAYTPGG
jgi:thermitase